MALRCALGLHKWDGCKCSACGHTRNERHDWSTDCEQCARCGKVREHCHDWRMDCEHCNRCGQVRNESHDWLQDCEQCARCGKLRDGCHDWSTDCEQCARCGKTRVEAHRWDGCKCQMCGKCGDVRHEAHVWDGCKCSACGQVRDAEHQWDGCTCTRCGQARPVEHLGEDNQCPACAKAREPQQDTRPPVTPDAAAPVVADGQAAWSRVASSDGRVRQVQIHVPSGAASETPLSVIMLPAGAYPILATTSWCAAPCVVNGAPLVMLRAGSFGRALRRTGFTMAWSFCHLPSHAVLMLDIVLDAPSHTAAIRQAHRHVPAVRRPVAEWLSGLDGKDRQLVGSVLASRPLRVVLAEDSQNVSTVFGPDGTRRTSAMPEALGEAVLHLPEAAVAALQQEFEALVTYAGKSSPSHDRFALATNFEVIRYLPLDQEPLLVPDC